MNNRIYAVTDTKTGEVRLVEAHHPSHAVRMVTQESFAVRVPSVSEVAKLLEAGTRVMREEPAQKGV
jgi:hypothetical protein